MSEQGGSPSDYNTYVRLGDILEIIDAEIKRLSAEIEEIKGHE